MSQSSKKAKGGSAAAAAAAAPTAAAAAAAATTPTAIPSPGDEPAAGGAAAAVAKKAKTTAVAKSSGAAGGPVQQPVVADDDHDEEQEAAVEAASEPADQEEAGQIFVVNDDDEASEPTQAFIVDKLNRMHKHKLSGATARGWAEMTATNLQREFSGYNWQSGNMLRSIVEYFIPSVEGPDSAIIIEFMRGFLFNQTVTWAGFAKRMSRFTMAGSAASLSGDACKAVAASLSSLSQDRDVGKYINTFEGIFAHSGVDVCLLRSDGQQPYPVFFAILKDKLISGLYDPAFRTKLTEDDSLSDWETLLDKIWALHPNYANPPPKVVDSSSNAKGNRSGNQNHGRGGRGGGSNNRGGRDSGSRGGDSGSSVDNDKGKDMGSSSSSAAGVVGGKGAPNNFKSGGGGNPTSKSA
jgi:hypothetical protein